MEPLKKSKQNSTSNEHVIGIYAYGNFGAPAGLHPKEQANNFKSWLDAINAAGYNVLVLSTFHVTPEGNLHDSAYVAKDGIFNPNLASDPAKALNPDLPKLLLDFKTAYGAKIYYSIGNAAGTNSDLKNLASLLEGYSSDSSVSNPSNPNFQNLVKNLALLKSDLHIDGIDFDFEPDEYGIENQTTISHFTQLVHHLGFEVSYCPYENESFWLEAQANACDPHQTGRGEPMVNWWNLQCYAGGTSNNPTKWLAALDKYIADHGNRLGIENTSKFILPGYGNDQFTAAQVQQFITNATSGKPPLTGGGWIWQLGQFLSGSKVSEQKLSEYAKAIVMRLVSK